MRRITTAGRLGNVAPLLLVIIALMTAALSSSSAQETGAAERRRDQARQKDLLAVRGTTQKPGGVGLENICDVQLAHSLSAYCLCDSLTLQDASSARCTVFNVTDQNDPIWESFGTQTGLQELQLNVHDDGRLTFIPSVALRHLPSLTSLQVKDADLDTLTPHTFADAQQLKELHLNKNKIRHIRPYAFQGLFKLTELELTQNGLSSLERGVFAGLDGLKALSLENNNISLIEDSVFISMTQLQELDLSGNQIAVITADTFQGLKQIKKLILKNNQLALLGDGTFTYTPNLKKLDLRFNSIQMIRDLALSGLHKLDSLNLTGNQLSGLDRSALSPIWFNLVNTSMSFSIQGNPFRCDCRLAWVRDLHSSSKSLKSSMELITCSYSDGDEEKNVVQLLKIMDCQTTTTAASTTSRRPSTVTSYVVLEDQPATKQINETGASMQLSSQQSKPSAQQSAGSGLVLLPANSSCSHLTAGYCVMVLALVLKLFP